MCSRPTRLAVECQAHDTDLIKYLFKINNYVTADYSSPLQYLRTLYTQHAPQVYYLHV